MAHVDESIIATKTTHCQYPSIPPRTMRRGTLFNDTWRIFYVTQYPKQSPHPLNRLAPTSPVAAYRGAAAPRFSCAK